MSADQDPILVPVARGSKSPLSSVPPEPMLRAILDGIAQGVFWKDRESRYLGCNQIVADAFGLSSPQDIVGLNDHQLPGLTEEQASGFIAYDQLVIRNNKPQLGIIESAKLANGTTIWMETNKFPLLDEQGNNSGVLGTWQDVTARKQAEGEAKERESLLHIFIEHSPVALAMFDRDMRYLHASSRWKSDLHLSNEDLRGRLHYEMFPDVPAHWKEIHRRGLAGEIIRSEEDIYERNDGTTQWFRWEVRPWADQNDTVGGILIFFEEITERKQAEKDLARLASIVESCDDAIVSKSLEGKILTWNASAERLFGYSATEAIGQLVTLIVPPEKFGEEKGILGRLSNGEQFRNLETVRLTKDGRRLDFSLTISPIRNTQGLVVGASTIARDITDQKKARVALHQREALLRLATDNAAVGLVMLNLDRQYIFVNAAYVRILNLPCAAEDLLGKRPSEVLADIYESRIRPRLDRAFAGENVMFEFTRAGAADKQPTLEYYSVVYDPMRDEFGAVDGVIVTIFDITERKRSEAELRESQERLTFALESSRIGAWNLELPDLTIERSLEHDRIFGYSQLLPAWSYAEFLDHIYADDRDSVHEKLQHCIATCSDCNFECRIVRSDKQIGWIWIAGRVQLDDQGTARRVAGVIQDITTRKKDAATRQKLESQIQHAQKLESLGVLAGGIAHDFNNILTSILGYTDLALLELPMHSPARALIGEAVNGARKAADLTKQMLAYSGKGKFVVQSLNLNDVIEDMIHLLQVSITKKCVLKLHLMPTLPSIEADAVQMRQVIMNLIINASDAIGEQSGIIAVTTGAMYCDRAYLSESYLDENLQEGLYVFLEVADTGCGMKADHRAKIFDPFFTTKATGRGLGLAAVLGIVRGHRGAIKVYSELSKGTTFKVAFPAVNLPPSLSPDTSSSTDLWKSSGTVLVVDDEETVRGLVRRMLEIMGFTVITANDGKEALSAFQRELNTIRLVILDMTMPHLDGPGTFRELRRLQSNVKAILTSGYNEQSAISQFAGKGLSGFIQKPFRYEELLSVVRRVLED